MKNNCAAALLALPSDVDITLNPAGICGQPVEPAPILAKPAALRPAVPGGPLSWLGEMPPMKWAGVEWGQARAPLQSQYGLRPSRLYGQ